MQNTARLQYWLPLAIFMAGSSSGFSQGCVCVRPSSPALLGQGFASPGTWQVGIGYRYLHSDRHFVGDVEQKQRQAEGSEVINDISYFDVTTTYAFNKRYSVTLAIPFQNATRSQVVRDNTPARNILDRFTTRADGLGDLRLTANAWLFDPEKYRKSNLSLGLGLKLPTGEKDHTDDFKVFDPGTASIVFQHRTVDQSIQPGDGGWGLIFDLLGYAEVAPKLTAYVQGSYISTPQESSGVPTFRSLPEEAFMSIADQYMGRAGFNYDLFPKTGLSFSLGARIEGVPVRDLIGGSAWFRRPGYAVSIEPGFTWRYRKAAISVNCPYALYRNRERSVPDELASLRTGVSRQGDAAFADWLVQANITYRF